MLLANFVSNDECQQERIKHSRSSYLPSHLAINYVFIHISTDEEIHVLVFLLYNIRILTRKDIFANYPIPCFINKLRLLSHSNRKTILFDFVFFGFGLYRLRLKQNHLTFRDFQPTINS